tara:strand:- start:314 stop:643 length:330 start_codon:yes stop_codon:yes gene_type:complete
MNSRISNLYQKPTETVTSMEMLTVPVSGDSDPVKTFTTSYNRMTKCIGIDVQDSDVYATFTGETPSATLGHRLYAGRSYTFNKITAQNAKFLNTSTATVAIIAATELTE